MIRENFVSYKMAEKIKALNLMDSIEDNGYRCYSGYYAKREFPYYMEGVGVDLRTEKGDFFFDWSLFEFTYNEDLFNQAYVYEDANPEEDFFTFFMLEAPLVSEVCAALRKKKIYVDVTTSCSDDGKAVFSVSVRTLEQLKDDSMDVVFQGGYFKSWNEALTFGMELAVDRLYREHLLNKNKKE